MLFFLVGIAVLSQDIPAFAGREDALPEGASAGVVDAKIRKDSEDALFAPKPVSDVGIEEEKAPEQKLTGPSFYVQRFILEGDLLLKREEYEPLLKKFEGREIKFQELQTLINALEQLFRAKGYIAVVLLPPQKMEKPEIRLKVVVSRMGKLHVENNRYYSAWRTSAYWKIRTGEMLHYDKIRQNVLDMNENSDRMVKPILKAGKDKGTTDVILNVEDHLPLHAGFSYDNQGVKLTGKDRPGFTVRNNNILGLDDIFLIGTTFGTDFGALYLYYLVPISNVGTKLILSYSHAQVNPKKEYAIYGINGLSDTFSIAVQQRVIRTDKYSGNVQIGFDFKEKTTETQNVTTVWDNERVLSLKGDFQARDKWGGWSLSPGVSFGMPTRGDGWPLAGGGGEHDFIKFNYDLTRLQVMPFRTKLLWDLQGQMTYNELLPQEQMFLGGAKSVRGYPESDYGADQAIQSRLDYLLPVYGMPDHWKLPYDTIPLKDQVSVIGFWDMGYGRIHDPSNTEERKDFLMGVGGGFEVKFRTNITGRFEWGVPLGDKPITESGKSQMHFTFSVNY
ncbi:MAG TPA: ShlB/FhaC/HecB family hemolysin secretion/activation protein [Candidatus Omnitrophota bacterium]|nr:ShlB/FhaC/HecB family hemolysin secretion/activation protein [Candidatus Omnitrophota bacterium]HPS37403.1 ShlB/FhaC/HecB family hemolysin secretion/activation protein [Candidatus Omnitrophota bacterium]